MHRNYNVPHMSPPFIVAEIAQGYEGSSTLAERSVVAAAAAGADAVKFQALFADESALPDYKYYQLYKGLELSETTWRHVVNLAHQKSLLFYADALGERSFHMLDHCGADGYKVHAGSITNFRLLRAVAQVGKPVLISTGGSEHQEVERAMDILASCDITLMHGIQAEPTEVADNHLHRIRTLVERYGKPVGLQDHTLGSTLMAQYLPFVAIGLGATVIEKHLALSRLAEIEDSISALTPEEFRGWARLLKQAFTALGSPVWMLSEQERAYKSKIRKAICAAREIRPGEVLTEDDLVFKRTHDASALYAREEVVGRRVQQSINSNALIRQVDLV